MPYPDVQQYSYRDYGNRLGFWRMLEVLDAYRIKCCVSLNLAVLEHHPEVAEAMVQRDWDFMSHGTYNTRYLNTYTEAQAGRRAVCCMDAAHFVFAPVLGIVWCWQRVCVKAPSGRQRLNVLAALNAMPQELCTVENLTYMTAETVCEL